MKVKLSDSSGALMTCKKQRVLYFSEREIPKEEQTNYMQASHAANDRGKQIAVKDMKDPDKVWDPSRQW